MALSTQASNLAKQRALHYDFKPKVRLFLRQAFSYWAQFTSKPDLQVVEFASLTNTDAVIADSPCRVYGIWSYKPVTGTAYIKGTNNATTCSTDGTQDVTILTNGAKTAALLIYPDGLSCSAGFTMRGNTTASTGVSAGAAGSLGLCIVGAP